MANLNTSDEELFREDPDLQDMFTDGEEEEESEEEEAFDHQGSLPNPGLEVIGPKPSGGLAKALKKKLGGLVR